MVHTREWGGGLGDFLNFDVSSPIPPHSPSFFSCLHISVGGCFYCLQCWDGLYFFFYNDGCFLRFFLVFSCPCPELRVSYGQLRFCVLETRFLCPAWQQGSWFGREDRLGEKGRISYDVMLLTI